MARQRPVRRKRRVLDEARRNGVGWKAGGDIVAQRVGERVVLVDVASDRIYSLNPTAARVWELAVKASSMERVYADLAEEFRVDTAKLKRDVPRILRSLETKGLLERSRSRG